MQRGRSFRWALRQGEAGGRGLAERVLAARGIAVGEGLEAWLNPSLHRLHDAGLLPNLDRAVDRVIELIRAMETSPGSVGPIVIYGDYDVDGISASAILYHVFRTATPHADVRTYIPHRLTEGYGLNEEALREIAAEGASLVISVDCGITAAGPAAAARALGLDLIITDHHNLPGEGEALPEAFAVVHPRLPGSEYPFGELCGAGVAFKFAWRFATRWCGSERVTERFRSALLDGLSLAALGTIADVVPLQDENRIIARFGLANMRNTSLIGLNALIAASGLDDDQRVDSTAVGFRLAPRLNACGRMGHAKEALRLFVTEDAAEAAKIAAELNLLNQQRQQVERQIFEQACAMAEEAGMTRPGTHAVVLAHPEWHPGVIGIVCSRIVERFGRPTILLQAGEDLYRGSARSIEGYSIHGALAEAAECLESWGGHDMAAGMALRPERFGEFQARILEHAGRSIAPENLTPLLEIDCAAGVEELTSPEVERLLSLGPFGRGNPEPALLLSEARVTTAAKVMGNGGRHLSVGVGENGRRGIRLVGWGLGAEVRTLHQGAAVDVVIRPKINTWQGRRSVEGEIVDYCLR